MAFAVLVTGITTRGSNFSTGLPGGAGGNIAGVFVGAGFGGTGGIAGCGVGLCRVDGADLIFGLLIFLAAVQAVAVAGGAGECAGFGTGRAVSWVGKGYCTRTSCGHSRDAGVDAGCRG